MAGEIQLNSTTFATESGGAITVSNVNSATNRTNLGLGSIATQASDSIDINGGTIDGTTIGGTSAAAGTFTTFTSTGIDDNASSTALTIDSSGTLLVGTTTSSGNGVIIAPEASGGNIAIRQNTTSSKVIHYFVNPNGLVGNISISGSSTIYNTSSDYRLKENITEITDGISRLKQLNPSRFNFISDPDKTVDGFIAHEVQDIVPEAVSGEKNAVDLDGKPEYQGVDYGRITPLLTAALKEAIAKIEMLEARIAVLEAK